MAEKGEVVAYDEGEVVYEEESEAEGEEGDVEEADVEEAGEQMSSLHAGGHGETHASRKNKQTEPSAFMSRVLNDVTQHASPNMLSVLFENQLEIARGLRCVIRVPRRPTSPTRWGLLCPTMASVDRANEARAKQSTDPFSYYDGFDMYTSELEARDTRFSDPLIVRPNPVFDSALVENTFVDRKVFSNSQEEEEGAEERAEEEAGEEEEYDAE